MPQRPALRSSPSIEDYLERIYELVERKGYARAVDIASSLTIRQSSVTKMIQRLHRQGYVIYEKYRGMTLTSKGEALAKAVWGRHKTLAQFFRMLGVSEDVLQRDVEGIEHHVSASTLACLRDLVQYFEGHPQMLREFQERRQGNGRKTREN
jgi:Mn-dependent DtxR family transcriptional regulator